MDFVSCLSWISSITVGIIRIQKKQQKKTGEKKGEIDPTKETSSRIGARFSGHCALDQTVGIGLRDINLSILTGIFQALVPAEVELEVMFIRQGEVDCLNQWLNLEDFVCHFIHGILYAGAILLGEEFEDGIPCRLPSSVENRCLFFHQLVHRRKGLPCPCPVNVGTQDPIPRIFQSRVLVVDEPVKLASGALQHRQSLYAGRHLDPARPLDNHVNHSFLLAVAHEAMGVRLSVDIHACPTMQHNIDMCCMDVGILVDEMGANGGREELRRIDGVLLGENKDAILDGVCGYNYAIVGADIAVIS